MSTTKQASKHTPGPWMLSTPPVCANRFRYVENETEIIAEVRDTSEGVFVDHANARLIAAAPELLEAIQSCAAWLERYMDKDEAHFEPQKTALAKARAAIAKATGNA